MEYEEESYPNQERFSERKYFLKQQKNNVSTYGVKNPNRAEKYITYLHTTDCLRGVQKKSHSVSRGTDNLLNIYQHNLWLVNTWQKKCEHAIDWYVANVNKTVLKCTKYLT